MVTLETISNSDAMVPYEALASRFGRAVEVVSSKLFRAIELAETQENQEFIRDRLLKMEKIALISSAGDSVISNARDFGTPLLPSKLPHNFFFLVRESIPTPKVATLISSSMPKATAPRVISYHVKLQWISDGLRTKNRRASCGAGASFARRAGFHCHTSAHSTDLSCLSSIGAEEV
jgi:hypothetical protein